jgi:hypothetical protein
LAVFIGAETAKAQAQPRESAAAAEVPPPPPPPELHRTFPRFERGAQELALIAGYGIGLDLGASQSGDTRLVAVLPHWGIALTRPYGVDRAFAGSLSLLVEGVYLRSLDPHRGNSGGANLIFRNHFLALGRFVPFLELGAGMASVDFDLQEQRDGFDFTLETGAGAHFFLSRHVTLTLEWRLHHISNAGIHKPNEGINTSHFLGGLSFFLG